MSEQRTAIVDYGMGNLYNVVRACAHVGLAPVVTQDPKVVLAADMAILPGVGAMADAMAELDRLGMSDALRARAATDRPLIGICLGLQLLMEQGTEFGEHTGLGIIPGVVKRFPPRLADGRRLRVPHIGWSPVQTPADRPDAWADTPMATMHDATLQYFVHSYYVVPTDPGVVVAVSRYGDVEFCSALATGSVFACQFHPERSGASGLELYETLARVANGRFALGS